MKNKPSLHFSFFITFFLHIFGLFCTKIIYFRFFSIFPKWILLHFNHLSDFLLIHVTAQLRSERTACGGWGVTRPYWGGAFCATRSYRQTLFVQHAVSTIFFCVTYAFERGFFCATRCMCKIHLVHSFYIRKAFFV